MALSVFVLFSSFHVLLAESKEGAPGDLYASWASDTLQEWWAKEWIHGYPDGTFRPDSNISRAEFISLVNRALGLSTPGDISFRDIKQNDWAYEAIAIANRAGYVSGYEDGTIRPDQAVSREEVAFMVYTLLQVEATKSDVSRFLDTADFAGWSQDAIGELAAVGILSGYPDGAFRPGNKITRAEAVVVLNNTIRYILTERPKAYTQSGEFGSAAGIPTFIGNATVQSSGVTLNNLLILGDLDIKGEGASGEITLQNVFVRGKTSITGGASLVRGVDSTLGDLNVCTSSAPIRIVLSGRTQVGQTTLCSSAVLEEKQLTGDGFREVILAADMASGSIAELRGAFDTVVVNASGAKLQLEQGTIQNVTFGPDSGGSIGRVTPEASIGHLVLDAVVTMSGQGAIETATLNAGARGTTFERKPGRMDGEEGGSVVVPPVGGGNSGGAVVQPDTTPPLFDVGYPKWLTGSETSAFIVVKANKQGRLYALAALPSDPLPSSLQVKAGQTGSGSPAISTAVSAFAANTETSIPVNGLTAGTEYSLYVVAEDNLGNIQTKPAAEIVKTSGVAPLKFVTSSLPNGKVGAAYSPLTIESSGGVGTRNYSLMSGALPAGMAVTSKGVFSGTPSLAGAYTFTLKVTDSQSASAIQVFIVVIDPPTPVKFDTTSLPSGQAGIAYKPLTMESSGGIGTRTYSLMSGGLPVGMAVTSKGVFSGTPSLAGAYTFTLKVTDSQSASAIQVFTVVIDPPAPLKIDTTSLPSGKVGIAYKPLTIESSGGVGTRTYSLISGGLPVGMAVTSKGVFSGTPSLAGAYTFTMRVTDSQPASAIQVFTVVIDPPAPLKFDTTSLPSGQVGAAYKPLTIESSGGVGTRTYSLISGALPVGMAISSKGVFSGTPSLAGSYTFTLRVTDSQPASANQMFTVVIDPPDPVKFDTTSLPNGQVGKAYKSLTIESSGGVGTRTYSLISGALPAGMAISSKGVFSGTPSLAGSYTFTLRVTDSQSASTNQMFTVIVNP
ncbi:putative Ig domain-containing protein [Paenibacillus hodogayensis]